MAMSWDENLNKREKTDISYPVLRRIRYRSTGGELIMMSYSQQESGRKNIRFPLAESVRLG